MSIAINSNGGEGWRSRIASNPDDAMSALRGIQQHLEQPGKAKGVLTLVNRSHNDRELKLERKSGLQLLGRGSNNQRLNDTTHAIRTLLANAGLKEARDELDAYLAADKRHGNRISASALLALLNTHLPEPSVDGGDGRIFLDGEGAQVQPPIVDHQSAARAEAPVVDHQPAAEVQQPNAAPQLAAQVQQPVQAPRPEQYAGSDLYPPKTVGLSVNELLKNAQMSVPKNGVLGEGAFGKVRKLRVQEQQAPMVLKTFKQGGLQQLSLARDGNGNEAIAAYLTSKKDRTYAARVNVVQPEYYLVRKAGTYMMVDPLALRALLKDRSSRGNVFCVGTVMKMAEGEEVFSLSDQLSPAQKKQVFRGTLASVSVLNERGFVHRDIKPENAFFDTASGKLSLIDTGMLHKRSKTDANSDTVSTLAGTPLYMHPKIWANRPYGTEADLYASAMMALELQSPLTMRVIENEFIKPIHDALKSGLSVSGNRFFNKERLVGRMDAYLAALPASGGTAGEQAWRAGLNSFKAELADPNSFGSLIMDCLMASTDRPTNINWRDPAQASQVYRDILSDPRLNQV
jgi:serine/threonine protein kinase